MKRLYEVPWKVTPDYSCANVYRLWNRHGNYHRDTSPHAMNQVAELMAAAPKLLACCKAMLKYADRMSAKDVEKIKEAILSATLLDE